MKLKWLNECLINLWTFSFLTYNNFPNVRTSVRLYRKTSANLNQISAKLSKIIKFIPEKVLNSVDFRLFHFT